MSGSDDLPTGEENDLELRRRRGANIYADTLGVPAADAATELAARVGPTFADEAILAAGGAAWSHPGLTPRERSIAVITALTAQGVAGDRLATHVQRGHDEGLDDDAMIGLMILLAGYIGYPRASIAMQAIHRA